MTTSENSCVIRRAGVGDLVSVLTVHAHRDGVIDAAIVASAEQRRAWDRMMATDDLVVYIAELRGEPIGTASSMMMPNLTYECAPTAFIEAVAVVVHHRREGVATQMIRRILDDTRDAGCNKVQLLSHKRHANDGAHHLYRSLGFEPEAEGFRLYHREVPAAARLAAEPGPTDGNRPG